jgi:quercetin dioxygenase-like cupin family protein
MEKYNWARVAQEEVSLLITRQVIHTPSLTMLRLNFRRGAVVALHRHVHEQVTSVVSGRLRLQVGEEMVEVGPGEVARVPSDVPHLAEAIEDTVAIDVFTPARTDWQ